MDQEFKCMARVEFMGKDLHLNKIIARIELEDMMPPRGPILDPMDLQRAQESNERRRRFVDFVAAEFAHSLTEALFKQARS